MWCFNQILEELFFCGGSLTCWGIFGLSTGRISSHRIMLRHHRIPTHGTVRIECRNCMPLSFLSPQTLPHEAEIWKLLHAVSEPRSVRVSWNVWDVGYLMIFVWTSQTLLQLALKFWGWIPSTAQVCERARPRSQSRTLTSACCWFIGSCLIPFTAFHLHFRRIHHAMHCWGCSLLHGLFLVPISNSGRWFKHFSLPCSAQGHRWSWCHYVVGMPSLQV